MKVKKVKAEVGEAMYWADYLSLPFTQMVSVFSIHNGSIT